MIRRISLAGTAVAVFALLSSCSMSTDVMDTQKQVQLQLRLIETSDLHAHLLGFDYYGDDTNSKLGLAHAATTIRQLRAELPNSILIDNGDLIQGSPLGDFVVAHSEHEQPDWQHPMIAAMNTLEYDVANVGNHEFNFGLSFLEATLSGADFPYISANTYHASKEQHWIQPHVLLKRQLTTNSGESVAITIGVFGVVPPQIMQWDRQHLEGVLSVTDIVTEARTQVRALKEQGADVIIAVPHSGIDYRNREVLYAEQAVYQLAGIKDIDAILFGHQHRLFPGHKDYDDIPYVDNEAGRIRGIPAVQPGMFGDHVGVIDLSLSFNGETWDVDGANVKNIPVAEKPDAKIVALAKSVHQGTREFLLRAVGTSQVPLNNKHARTSPSSAVQFVHDAQLWYAKRALASTALPELPVLSAASPFRSQTSLTPGAVTLGELADLYPYPNTLEVVRLNGAQVREWLEMSARSVATEATDQGNWRAIANPAVANYHFDSLLAANGKLRYEIDPTQPERYDDSGVLRGVTAKRIKNLTYNGQRVNQSMSFYVVTNNYRASGGGNFPNLTADKVVYSSPDEIRSILVSYLKTLGEQGYQRDIEPVWRIKK